MNWNDMNKLTLQDAYDLTKPLSTAERTYIKNKALEDATGGRTVPYIIQDSEKPLCLQCGDPLDVKGVCACCGRVKKEPR